MQADPQLADTAAHSATLDSIGAWSAVQPAPPATAAFRPYDLAPGIRSLDSKYSRLALAHGALPTPLDPPGSVAFRDALDAYSAFAAPPAVLRAGHPLAAANPPGDDVDYSELDEAILRVRSTTLPNIFAMPNPRYRFSTIPAADAAAAAAPIPVSPASTSTLSMMSRHGSVSVANSNRTVSPLGLSLSAIPIHQTASLDNHLSSPREASSHTSSHTSRLDMLAGAGFLGKSGTAAMSGSVSSTGSLAGIGSSVTAPIRRFSEYVAEHPASPLSLTLLPACPAAPDGGMRGAALAGDSINTSGASRAGVHQAASTAGPAVARCAGFGPHLPTMREEDASGDGAGPSSVLGSSGDALVDAEATTRLPPRIQSLKDMRRTSLDAGPDEQATGGLHQSPSLNQLAGATGLYRRHSLASTNLPTGAPAGVAGPMPFGVLHPAYLPQPHTGMMYCPPPMLPPGMFHFGMHPGTMPRQNSLPHLAAGMHYAGGPYNGLAPYEPMPLQQPMPGPEWPHPATQSGGPQHLHARRASHPGIPVSGPSAAPAGAAPSVPLLAGGPHSATHPLMPNPATTITPNMPFADMGKGLAYQSLPRGTRVFVVQFKGRRCDIFFAPRKGMATRAIPTLAPAAASQPAPAPAQRSCGKAKYAHGTYVLVEADRGIDLGVIKEELATAEAIRSFSSALAEAAASSNGSSLGEDTDAPGGKAGDGGAAAKDVFVKRIFRVANQQEVADMQSNKIRDEQNALDLCQSKVQQRKLAMHVTDAEFQFDRRKLTFYFTASRRVDFRELVRDLFKHFKTRIWMYQLVSDDR
ncbi:hypothetical protein H4R19_002131 [Coemansia spiralis]|nr:hypothetical protein H4R19_002131 [Coemansia spiralis]